MLMTMLSRPLHVCISFHCAHVPPAFRRLSAWSYNAAFHLDLFRYKKIQQRHRKDGTLTLAAFIAHISQFLT